jgi:ABC-type dipeptide/oligopeptide/nickel transport system ATPase subunit
MAISIFEVYEIDQAFQIFKLVSLTAKKGTTLLLFGISAYGKSQVMNPESFFGELKRRNVIHACFQPLPTKYSVSTRGSSL